MILDESRNKQYCRLHYSDMKWSVLGTHAKTSSEVVFTDGYTVVWGARSSGSGLCSNGQFRTMASEDKSRPKHSGILSWEIRREECYRW